VCGVGSAQDAPEGLKHRSYQRRQQVRLECSERGSYWPKWDNLNTSKDNQLKQFKPIKYVCIYEFAVTLNNQIHLLCSMLGTSALLQIKGKDQAFILPFLYRPHAATQINS
jgi:hypothetical protein